MLDFIFSFICMTIAVFLIYMIVPGGGIAVIAIGVPFPYTLLFSISFIATIFAVNAERKR